MADLGNPQNTIDVLKRHQFTFQKKFGQNFLIDPRVLEKIIRAAEVSRDDFVLEIGPGIGTMTQYLAEAARQTGRDSFQVRLPVGSPLLPQRGKICPSNKSSNIWPPWGWPTASSNLTQVPPP